eukprot:Nitzschia sp. Nitz4//scaffold25_size161228//152328//154790//NITZ4_002457-RA/size161228-processed-gene-0.199-mRNA-1//-1//CDS//3329544667//7454//frame0
MSNLTKPVDDGASLESKNKSTEAGRRPITVLPQAVVDQIAAGEVVQRPASVVKELLENSLDAGSTSIIIQVEGGGLSKISINDNGKGISKMDLALAATRHATSKLTNIQDFRSLDTYGFRGEALASISMVSNVTITTRTADSPVGYQQKYRDGRPEGGNAPPKPMARTPGTTILVQNLFHNVPHRLQTYKKREQDEYQKILAVVQHYAIRYPHCGFCLERRKSQGRAGAPVVDVHTTQIPSVQHLIRKKEPPTEEERVQATKAIMGHVLEPLLDKHLSHVVVSKEAVKDSSDDIVYNAEVYFTSTAYSGKKTTFLLFVNDRLVDLAAWKRMLEDVYTEFGSSIKSIKPCLVVLVKVPGSQVDVNVHPSKRQVALMYQEEIGQALAQALRGQLHEQGQSFEKQSTRDAATTPSTKKTKTNPYANLPSSKRLRSSNSATATGEAMPSPVTMCQKTPPSRLIRTSKAAPVGAIEPFIVRTSREDAKMPARSSSSVANNEPVQGSVEDEVQHKPDCPQASQNIDLTQPGAFAKPCTCAPPRDPNVLVQRIGIRPKRVVPTQCDYASIHSLRRRVNKHTDAGLAKRLREAHYVGVVSTYRSMIQCGEELYMMHHGELAKQLFYQLALARFGGADAAKLGSPVDVNIAIGQALQLEDDLMTATQTKDQHSAIESMSNADDAPKVGETNFVLAEQATACLLEHADMLKDYFSIQVEKTIDNVTVLSGLPILLEGHSPEPHGLGIFLLRLATQVDWSAERPCFHGISRELGNFYAGLPTDQNQLKTYVHHTLFPAISYLLLPSQYHITDGNLNTLTRLSTLYKVFERC